MGAINALRAGEVPCEPVRRRRAEGNVAERKASIDGLVELSQADVLFDPAAKNDRVTSDDAGSTGRTRTFPQFPAI
jgi:hypothetical protein